MSGDDKIKLSERNIMFVDLETTGLDVNKHEILEVACLLVDGKTFKIKSKYYSKVKPTHIETATKEGLRIAQYNEDRWKEAKNIKTVLKEIVDFAPNAMVAGWKVDFDWNFLEKGIRKFKIKHSFDYHLIDVISLGYLYLWKKNKLEWLSLGTVAKELGIPIHPKHHEGEGHGAMEDIEATYKVFIKLVDEFRIS